MRLPSASIMSIGIVIMVLVSGCQDRIELTEIQPDVVDLGSDWMIQSNTTHEFDYSSPRTGDEIYGLTVPEYLLVRYTGVSVQQSCNFNAVRCEDSAMVTDVFNRYVDKTLQHGQGVSSYEQIGDETFLAAVSLASLVGFVLIFRMGTIVIILAGFNVDQQWIENLGASVASDIHTVYGI